MTVTDVCILDYGPSRTATGRQYDVVYRVTYSGTFDPLAAINGTVTGLPAFGAAATWDTDCYCVNLSKPVLSNSLTFYTQTATFTQNVWIDIKDKMETDQCEEQREVFLDFDGKPLVNTANQVFDSVPCVDFTVNQFTVTGYRTTYKVPQTSKWHLVNTSSITLDGKTFAAKTLRYAGCQTQRVKIEGGYNFIQHRWTFREKVDPDNTNPWDIRLSNKGTVDKDGKRIKINGRYVETPYPLDANGAPLYGVVGDNFFAPPDPANVLHLDFDVTQDFDFSFFGFNF